MTKILYFIIIVTFMDTFVQLPIISPFAIDLGASEVMAGVIVGIYSFSNMFGNIIGGIGVDRLGRKRVLLFAMAAVFLLLLCYPLVETDLQLLLLRFVHGVFGGILIPASFAIVGDLSRRKNGQASMAYTGAAIGIAAIAGPAIGGIMAARSEISYVFLFVAGLFLLSFFLGWKFVPRTLPEEKRQKVALSGFLPILKNRQVWQASVAAFALMVSNGTLAFALPLQVESFGLSASLAGAFLSIFGITALIIFITPLNKVYRKYSSLLLVLAGLLLIGLSLLLLPFIGGGTGTGVLMVVYGIGFALIFPSMNEMVAHSSKETDRGKAYGVFYAFFSLGVVAGSSGAGAMEQWMSSPFLGSGGFMLLIAMVLWRSGHVSGALFIR
ncbi:MFS transporter [Salimicrobium halophilum]|uniref:Predicted arabinose efflux permease, MFS family n=1 Tax=Salimicrobium halophilum TaxID=86666 RepID=A0A1G8VVM7_9BACI|nr:MFS transporter [Salimicrobium halophilum]SDJ70029.1 Predicted arabinose efflux permease, MFS family [Salimicrobium halophilum]